MEQIPQEDDNVPDEPGFQAAPIGDAKYISSGEIGFEYVTLKEGDEPVEYRYDFPKKWKLDEMLNFEDDDCRQYFLGHDFSGCQPDAVM